MNNNAHCGMMDNHDKILCERLATTIDHGICKCHERHRIAGKTAEAMLQAGRDVMAVIHGDGGHYREAHGDRKAADDAISIICKLRVDLDDARIELNRLHAGEMPGGWTAELESQIAARHAERERREAAEAELAERTRERDEHAKWRMALADKLHDRETELAAERKRRDAAEVALRMIRIDAAWAIDAQQQVINHFARYKD